MFDNGDKIKALEFQLENVRKYTTRLEREAAEIEHKAADKLKSADLLITQLQGVINKNEIIISELTITIANYADIPHRTLSAIQIFVRALGLTLLIASLALARSLGYNVVADSNYTTIWGLYLFCQFAGLYLVGFGTPTTLRSITIFGTYMCTLLTIIATIIVASLIGLLENPITQELIFLAIVNSIGVPTLIYVERRLPHQAS